MERTYKNATIVKNYNGKWIVTHTDGAHTQHTTLSDAKDRISARELVASM